MTDTITLTREQWNEVVDGLDLIRDRYDALFEIAAALSALGLDKPAGTITAVEDDISLKIASLQDTLMRARPVKPVSAKPRAMPKWFWPLNKSNREA